MPDAYSFACREFPGMGDCPGKVTAASEDEVIRLAELHAVIAHGEDPSSWSAEDRDTLIGLIRPEPAV